MVDFCKFDNFRRFFRDNSAKIYRSDLPKSGKDASRWDLNLSGQKFSSKINSSAGIFKKPKKIGKNSRLCPLWASLEPKKNKKFEGLKGSKILDFKIYNLIPMQMKFNKTCLFLYSSKFYEKSAWAKMVPKKIANMPILAGGLRL